MTMKKTMKWIIILAAAVMTACGSGSDSATLEFQAVSADRTVSIASEEGAPTCSVSVKLEAAAESQGQRAADVNETLARELLDLETSNLKTAADSFARAYTESYRQNIGPLYRDDRGDPAKRQWYEYRYSAEGKADEGRSGVTVYTANVSYYEGGAHGVSQRLLLNFDNKTGRRLTLADVFAPGYERQLNSMLTERLMAQAGADDMEGLRAKGFLQQTEMFATENFALGKDAITFVYNAYEIAPYENGITELTIDYGDCKEILQTAD